MPDAARILVLFAHLDLGRSRSNREQQRLREIDAHARRYRERLCELGAVPRNPAREA
jgi:hypothetical protein